MENTRILKSADKLLELIEVLANSSAPLSASEISTALNMNRTTAYGLINTLLAHEYIEKEIRTNKFTISAKLFELGSKFRFKLPFITPASNAAEKIVSKWHLSVHIAIYQNIGKIIFVHMHLPVDAVGIPVGYVAPAYCNAAGKILMANLPQDVLDFHLDKMVFEKRTQHTFTDKELFKKELMQCRINGYAQDKEEFLDGLSCIAAPIFDFSGKAVASISISGPTISIAEHEKELIEEVKAAAKKVSTEIGYSWGTKPIN